MISFKNILPKNTLSLFGKGFWPLLMIALLVACADSNLYEDEPGKQNPSPLPEAEPGETLFGVFINDADERTRAIDFTEGATVQINSLWLGVFNIDNGKCVEKKEVLQDYRYLTGDREEQGVIRVTFNGPNDGGNGNYFMVAVANYGDINDAATSSVTKARNSQNGQAGNLETLQELLMKVTTWAEFNAIGVDTESAYIAPRDNNAPLMVGFLNSRSAYNANISGSTHIRYNQHDETNDPIKILPQTLQNDQNVKTAITIKWNGNTNVKRYVASAGAQALEHNIFFRRLVANINVHIEKGDPADYNDLTHDFEDLEISNVQYLRFNMPNAVYLLERQMLPPNGTSFGDFPTLGSKSPNFADLDFSTAYASDGMASGYRDDDPSETSWIIQGVNPDETGAYNFSFQHFANKHWSRTPITDYAQRGAIGKFNGRPYFTALATGPNDINNNASYFKVKMHLLNKAKNRSADAIFTIMEGYTSDQNGFDRARNGGYNGTNKDAEWKQLIANDFSVARNINYTYNLRVYGFKTLVTNVNGGQNITHRADMGGTIWQMIYATEEVAVNENTGEIESNHSVRYYPDTKTYDNAIPAYPSEEENEGIYENFLRINNDGIPLMAFRLYGYDSEKKQILGYNYQFQGESFDRLKDLWPPQSPTHSNYFDGYDALVANYFQTAQDDKDPINGLLLKTFHFIEADKYDSGKQNRQLQQQQIDENGDVIEGLDPDYNYWMDIVQLMMYLRGKSDVHMNFHLWVSDRQIDAVPAANKGDFIRAIFVGDRNEPADIQDGCTTLIHIFGAVQDPPVY